MKSIRVSLIIVFFAFFCCSSFSQPSDTTITVKLGLVTPRTNYFPAFNDANDIWKAYLFTIDYANAMNNGKGIKIGTNNVYVKFQFVVKDDTNNVTLARIMLNEIVNEVDFVLGAHTSRAAMEGDICNKAKKILVVCCAGPNAIYLDDREWMFGIHGDSNRYSEQFIKSVKLKGANKIGVGYLVSSVFSLNLGQASIGYAQSSHYDLVTSYAYNSSADVTKYYEPFKAAAQAMIDQKIDVFVGSTLAADAEWWYRVWAETRYPLKGFFLAVAPADMTWLAQKGEGAQYITTGSQWDPTMRSKDDFFGTATEFAQKYERYWNGTHKAWYNTAAGGATVYTIIVALNETFSKQVVDPNTVLNSSNYADIRFTMSRMFINCFFGDIEFNRLRRNRKPVITLQAINTPVPSVVFPVEESSTEIIYPIPGTLWIEWDEGPAIFLVVMSSVAIFLAILIGVLLFVYRRHAKITSPLFNVLSVFGACFAASSAFFLPGIPSDGTCNALPWFYVCGWVMMMGSLLAKTWRIYRIVANVVEMSMVIVTDLEVFITSSILLLVNIFVLSLWMGISKMVQKNAQCSGKYTAEFIITFIVLFGIQTLALCVLGFSVRTFRTPFNDATILMFAGFYLCVIGVIFIPLIFYIDFSAQPGVHLILKTTGILFSTVGVIYVLFVPVLYKMFCLPSFTGTGGKSTVSSIGIRTHKPVTTAGSEVNSG
eukprot:TRINITY_DN6522_c0_g1_i1.p1 TRINITY_DN6522_c0_g1~~TRINITY_DN6522_c0_g1_i1.p1  ORF type:complete len:710 (-),score=193.17 TRINITY_DN6522_c0_g1_i1:60-2189(-)